MSQVRRVDKSQSFLFVFFPSSQLSKNKAVPGPAWVFGTGHFRSSLQHSQCQIKPHLLAYFRRWWDDDASVSTITSSTAPVWERSDRHKTENPKTVLSAVPKLPIPALVVHKLPDGVAFSSSVQNLCKQLDHHKAFKTALISTQLPPAIPEPLPPGPSRRNSLPSSASEQIARAEKRSASEAKQSKEKKAKTDVLPRRHSIASDPASWEHFDSQAYKVLVTDSVGVISDSIQAMKNIDVSSYRILYKHGDMWRCTCQSFQQSSTCFHTKSLVLWCESGHPPLADEEEVDEAVCLFADRVWIAPSTGYTKELVVVSDKRVFRCSSRSCGGRADCPHISLIKRAFPDSARLYTESKSSDPVPDLRPPTRAVLSNYSVVHPLNRDPELSQIRGLEALNTGIDLKPTIPAELCHCKQQYSASNFTRICSLTAFLIKGPVQCQLFALDCPRHNKQCRINYDGRGARLWLVSPYTAFSLELLSSCMTQVIDLRRRF